MVAKEMSFGEEGRGIRTAIEMAHLTRLDFAIGSAGLMPLFKNCAYSGFPPLKSARLSFP